ncbi:16S rRNA (guanine(966)-N(2))-methyltransferase RsmD [Candidatus Marinamargulisbacteria bacterium SCGC AG-343-D04]|nr:16S rRNA (guanine(966)-N(2))-methyltransferase RsmD [Candidatus Marinamargulisbacteria bacterium SCGC AG-343-D04]
MRIIAGKYKGRTLDYKGSKDCRPTKDRIKEALFSVLNDRCEGATCLDLFAGSGSLGLEALSRGAEYVEFVDLDIDLVSKNIKRIKDELSVDVHKCEASRFIEKSKKKYDIIFLDPPWTKEDFFSSSLKAIFEFDILKKDGWIICEHPVRVDVKSCFIKKQKKYKDTVLTFIYRGNE